jgi:hypothetical protein
LLQDLLARWQEPRVQFSEGMIEYSGRIFGTWSNTHPRVSTIERLFCRNQLLFEGPHIAALRYRLERQAR